MSDKFRNIAIKSLTEKIVKKLNITESRMVYEDGYDERMNPYLAKQLRDRKTSLGTHPIFPESDEMHFEEKLMSKRFGDVVKNFKRHHGTDKIDLVKFYAEQKALMLDIISREMKYKTELEDLAIRLACEEFDVDESDVEIIANLTSDLAIIKTDKKLVPSPDVDGKFNSHEDLVIANAEVYKRRFINALIQGSAKKVNHMFHLVDEELMDMDPLLPNYYSKLMTGADYAYLLEKDSRPKMIGGSVKVEFPKVEGRRPKITAEAVTFPVLVHEIVKGIMEVLSAHGLPQNSDLAKYVIGKADYMNAETWDMRLGPPIWEKFIESIPTEDYNLKHYVYVELMALPVKEFNETMRELMMGSRSGKAKIREIITDIKEDLVNDDFDNSMEFLSDDDFLGPEDLDNIDDETWFS